MAGSTAITVEAAAERLLPALSAAARAIRVGPTDDPAQQPDMGPVITGQHRDRILGLVGASEGEGAKVLCDGRDLKVADSPRGFYLGRPSSTMSGRHDPCAGGSLWAGPECHAHGDLDQPSPCQPLGFRQRRRHLHRAAGGGPRFKHRVKAGMVGINVGVPATMAMFPFTGWDDSFYGDLHIQGREAVQFYTQQKVITLGGSAATFPTSGGASRSAPAPGSSFRFAPKARRIFP